MKEFLKSIIIEPFTESDWLGYILGVLVWILTIATIGALIWLSVWLIDSLHLPLKEKEGVVTGHYYVPAHTTTTFIMSGEVMIPINNYIDDSFEITIEIDGLTDNVCLTQSSWSRIKVGDKLCCKYTNGRICKTIYIKSFCGGD